MPVALIAIVAMLNIAGVCIHTGSRLDDDEIREIATQLAYDSYLAISGGPNATTILGEGFTEYSSRNEFESANPDCCTIYAPSHPQWRDENKVGFWAMANGLFRSWIHIEIISGEDMVYRSIWVVANCGRIQNERY